MEMESNKVNVVSLDEAVKDSEDGPITDGILSFLGSFNRYATKKTAGQGLLDFALLAANVSKLQDLFKHKRRDAIFYVLFVIICISIVLQLIAGVLMGLVANLTMKTEKDRKKADVLNNVITVLLSVISFVNVIISVTDVSASGE